MKSKLMNEAIRLTIDINTHRIKHEANKPKERERELEKQSNGNKSKEKKNKLSKDRNIHNSVQFTNKTLN